MIGSRRNVTTVRSGGQLDIRWTCPACQHENERVLSGRPWYCSECGHHDRDVEMQADRIADSEVGR